MPTKKAVLQQLFLREVNRTPITERHELSHCDIPEIEFATWGRDKRDFSFDEIFESHWIKTCTAGYITELIFKADGSVTEFTLFDRLKTVGHWKLDDGLLHVSIFKDENQYDFIIVANVKVNIHSAIEYKNGELHSYLKLAQTRV
ncbi:hypothetical protein PVK64_05590 [Aliivibrio sp. S4TY2]|uniref:hypothetical protein n=1 Tax=unclassified Aliivibrio TaxID=2645654 RepID=UPI0023783B9B|nr:MULTISPECIES: hypothetical protein [unclassified Aliivibrio]MDD9155656.1 hypothetical protein [Aliivibrio sp. S4TY2]MDD9160523.1 hypothetical protein [Aliivibrio sp. S4TY1]MDD9164579.1 hypothetical protein [Aliivibrio sp. S4MY2]MDD9168385.1 hypothetical protein [Aliivibrio sp. S4MY4]MDD9184913.1 hypothetical protein [Aliivibrio sp. S4MY3]